jgi:2-dehydropantoate 2-reductase
MHEAPIAIVGAGSVGLVLAGRLAAAGLRVCLHVRRPEAATALREQGITLEEPASGARTRMRVDAVAAPPLDREGPVFVCVRGADTEAAAAALAARSPRALPVNVQNGVEGDAVLARRFAHVVGAVWRLTCTRVGATRVRAPTGGRIVLGVHGDEAPREVHCCVSALAEVLRDAGLDVGVSSRIAEDRWLKLCVNLMSSANALVPQAQHATAAFVAGKTRLLEEARAVLAAAGISTRSCDGRDRSLDEEIEHQRGALARGDAARRLPLYNDTWRALAEDLPLETAAFHRTIVSLGVRHGVPTPLNERVLGHLERAGRERLGPECVPVETLLGSA